MSTTAKGKRKVKKVVAKLVCFGLIAMGFVGGGPKNGAASERSRPNIVLIMADDVGYGDLGCYGQQLMETPNLDRLASEGLRFTQAYAGGAVCTPSRSVLMTGLHNGHTPARDNVPHYGTYLNEKDVTIAEVLRDADYQCVGAGKWSLGDAGTVGRATNQGFDHWFGYLNQDHAHYYYPEYLDDDDERLELTGNTTARTHYSHDLLTERAISFIDAARDRPFFLYAAYTVPHFSAKEEDVDGLTVPSTKPYSDRDWPTKAKKYAAMINRLDRDVGRIVERIDRLGLSEQTLVIFTSDNGGHKTLPLLLKTSGPLRGFKRDLTEGGIRVPFIARWPGIVPAGKTSDQVIAFQDMLPTFAELAGAAPPKHTDGISVTRALRGKALIEARDYLYWDYGHCRGRYHQAVRWKDWKGIRSRSHRGIVSEMELYDLSQDIGEDHNVASEHPEVVRRIADIMKRACVPSEKYPIGEVYRGEAIWKPLR